MREGELAQVLDDIWAKSSTRNWIIGRLGVDGGAPEDIDVYGRPGYVVVSMGTQGDQGITVAKDKAGVAKLVFQEVRMRRELGELVIREASAYAGSSNGSGGGSTTLDGLTDVTVTTPTSGQTLTYNGSQWVNQTGGAGMVAHDLSGSYHTGLLNWDDISFIGSSITDLADHAHASLSGMTPNDHHMQVHDILGPDHTITAASNQVVMTTATNTLGLMGATHDPGNTEKILKTTPDGSLWLDSTLLRVEGTAHKVTIDSTLFVADAVSNQVTIGNSFFVADPALQRLTIDSDVLYVDAANNWVGINKAPAGAALDLIASSNADHTQRIKQKTGQTGRMWRVEDLDGNELIVLDSVGNLQSGRPGFVSGLTGWQMTPQGNLEANNIWARGELHATVFVKDEVHATGGTLLVATAATVHADAQIDSAAVDRDVFEVESTAAAFPGTGPLPLTIETTSASFSGTTLEVEAIGNVIEINDPPSGPGLYFTPGEIVRVKTEVPTGITDMWFVVQSATQADGYNGLSVTKKSGSDGVIPKGAALVSYGHPGDGRILMTSDWRTDEGYSPYIDVFNIGDAPWTADVGQIIPRMRMGQLKGVGVPGVSGISQWGMIAGSDLTDANSGYLIASNLGIRMVKVPLLFNNGTTDTGSWTADGNIRVGSNIGQDATTGLRVYTTGGANVAGNVVIGNETTGNFLRWNQTSGVLTVSGSLVIQDPGTTVTKSYVDAQDVAYDALAVDYGSAAFGNSKVYVNDRRLVKVDGTWTSGTNLISWVSVALHFANSAGTPRSVVNGNTGTLSVRMYLYVDLAQVGTLTMFGRTTQVVNDPNYILIAVCDPGANGTTKASVTVVGGSTYISGGNIVTQSIVANSIAALAINAGHIQGNQILINHLANETTSYIINGDTATQNNAQAYADRRRVVGVGRTDGAQGWGFGFDNNFISWTSLVVKFADGSQQSISNSSMTVSGASPFTYLYVNVDTQLPPAALTLSATTSITALGPSHVVIAVVEPAVATSLGGSGWPTLQAVAGATFISGDSIITGSIVAQNIAAGAIKAGKIDTDAVTAGTIESGAVTATKININGNIAINASGSINGNGKTYGSTGGGFFLGHSSSLYRFDIGDQNSYLRWDGDELLLRTKTALELHAEATDGDVLIFRQAGGVNTTNLRYLYSGGVGILSTAGVFRSDTRVEAPYLQMSDATPGTTHEVFRFNFNGVTRSVNYYSNGLLEYTGNLYTSGQIEAGFLISDSNRLRIGTRRDIGSDSEGGSIGDISWGWSGGLNPTWCLFVYLPGGTGQAGTPDPGWYRVALERR